MHILPNRRRTDQLTSELVLEYRKIGIAYACSIIRPALMSQDVETALQLCTELEQEAKAS